LDVRIGKCDPMIISDDWQKYTHKGAATADPQQDALTSDELGLLAIVNLRAVEWEDSLVTSVPIMAFLMGAMVSAGEWVLVADPDVKAMNAAEVAFLKQF